MAKLVHFSGLCGIVGTVLTLVMVFAATILSPWFRWDTNALSELGLGEVSLLFNTAAIIGGALNCIFALGVWKYLPGGRLVRIGAALLMLGSVSLFLVGIFTVAYPIVHAIVALGYFVLGPIGFILIGLETRMSRIRMFSLVAGVAALMAILVLPIIFLAVPFKVGFAVPEMIEALIFAAWTVFMGAHLLRAPSGES
jgi:hypothetical membrane protein